MQDSAIANNLSAISTGPMVTCLFISLFRSKGAAVFVTEATTARVSLKAFVLAGDGVSCTAPFFFASPPGTIF